MRYQKLGDRYQLRLESGEPVAATLLDWLGRHDIGFATMTGLGAFRSASVSWFNGRTLQYEPHQLDEQMEVVSLIGNASVKEYLPFTHLHVALAKRDLSVVGGHFNDAVVHPTLEISLRPEPVTIERVLDESCGLYLLDLSERVGG